LQRLPTWDLWHKNEFEQLDQFKALGMFGAPVKLPEGGILMRFHWQHQIKVNGSRTGLKPLQLWRLWLLAGVPACCQHPQLPRCGS